MPTAKKAPAVEVSIDEEGAAGGRDGGPRMRGAEFARLRASLGKSQRELAELLGLSLKAIESYEQGWRNVPAHVERLLYFLLFKLNEDEIRVEAPCWEAKGCPEASRAKCVAYVAKEGRFCWFFTGRLCGSAKPSASKPGAAGGGCYACEVFARMLSRVDGGNSRCQ